MCRFIQHFKFRTLSILRICHLNKFSECSNQFSHWDVWLHGQIIYSTIEHLSNINEMTIHNISDDVLFLNNPNQTQTQQQRQSQTSTPDVALQSQMISHRMQATSATSGLHTPGGTTASTPSNQSHLRSSYHQHQPPRSQVSSVRLSNISSGGSSDLDSREYFMFKLRYYQSRERKFSCAPKKT